MLPENVLRCKLLLWDFTSLLFLKTKLFWSGFVLFLRNVDNSSRISGLNSSLILVFSFSRDLSRNSCFLGFLVYSFLNPKVQSFPRKLKNIVFLYDGFAEPGYYILIDWDPRKFFLICLSHFCEVGSLVFMLTNISTLAFFSVKFLISKTRGYYLSKCLSYSLSA